MSSATCSQRTKNCNVSKIQFKRDEQDFCVDIWQSMEHGCCCKMLQKMFCHYRVTNRCYDRFFYAKLLQRGPRSRFIWNRCDQITHQGGKDSNEKLIAEVLVYFFWEDLKSDRNGWQNVYLWKEIMFKIKKILKNLRFHA